VGKPSFCLHAKIPDLGVAENKHDEVTCKQGIRRHGKNQLQGF